MVSGRGRIREWGQVLGVVFLEGLLVAVLYAAGRYVGSVSLSHFGTWMRDTAPGDAIMPLLRLVGLAYSSWLLLTTLVYVAMAGGVSEGATQRGSRLLPPKVVRRIVDAISAASIVVSTMTAHGGLASASPLPTTASPHPTPGPAGGPRSSKTTASRARLVEAVDWDAGSHGAVEEPEVSHVVVGRHLPHPGVIAHGSPSWGPAVPTPSAPSAANGFAGLAQGTKVVVVRPGDCLSVLAQRHLGSWLLDHKITALNVGRVQFDGRALQDEHWIGVGWVLVMPPEAVGAEVVGAVTPAQPQSAAPVADSTAVPGTATAHPHPVTPAATNGNRATSPAHAGAQLGRSATTAPVADRAGRARATPGRDGVASGWLAPTGAAGATLLATWALVEARRRRSRRLRLSRPGSVMPPTDPTVAPLTAAVLAASDLAGVDRLQAALYHLANIADPSLRVVVMLRHPDGRIDVQLVEAAEPAEPWTATDHLFWTLAPAADLPEDDPLVNPSPTLVQLGVCDDGAELYIDLEAVGVLGLTGNPETVRQVARALTATLVVSPAARLCRVLTLGFDPYGLDEQVEDRLVTAKSVESLLHEVEMTAKDVVRGVAQHDAGSSFRLRTLDPTSGWEPAVAIVAGTALADDEISRLQRLADGGGRGVAVVCDRVQARWTLELVDPASGWWQLNPLGQRVRPAQMAADELRELAAYLADADVEPVEMAGEPPYDGSRVKAGDDAARLRAAGEADPSPVAREAGSEYVEPDWLVMVRLFGPPDAINHNSEVLGAAGRGAPLEMLAWLVTHRDTATRTGAKEALWGGEDVKARTVTNAINGARALLRGLADEPSDEFIPGFNERLTLSRLVVSDYELVAHRLAFARRQDDPAAAAEILAGGLDLVRGVPLAGVEWLWADDNHLSSNLAIVGSALAAELAVLRLQAGQTKAAIDATTAGLEVIPGNEELIRLRMQACIDGGDRRAALTIYEKYESVTAARGESIGPAIAALRNELLRPGRQ